jgi:hypothetical protein
MRLSALEHGREWEPVADLMADGSVVQERAYTGLIRNDSVLDARGRVLLHCNGRTLIEASNGRVMGVFDANDDLIDARTGGRIATFRNGTQPVLFESEGHGPLPAQMQGMPPWAKRTGEVLTLFVTINVMQRGF